MTTAARLTGLRLLLGAVFALVSAEAWSQPAASKIGKPVGAAPPPAPAPAPSPAATPAPAAATQPPPAAAPGSPDNPPPEAAAREAAPPPSAPYTPTKAEPERTTYGKQHREGRRLLDAGDYLGALKALQAAYDSSQRAAILYDIGVAYRHLTWDDQASDAFRNFIVKAKNPPPELHEAARRHISELDERRTQAELNKPAPPPPPEKPKGPLLGFKLRWWHATAVAAAGFTTGAVFAGLSARHRYRELLRTCGTTFGGCMSSQIDSVRSKVLVTNLLITGAALAAAGTGVLIYFDMRKERQEVGVAWAF